MATRVSRKWIAGAAAGLVAFTLTYALWPRPMAVEIGKVQRANMIVTIDEEARTEVRDSYVVSAPIAGRLLRVAVKAGDLVRGGQSVVARMLPTNVPALDRRTRTQAQTAVEAAEAGLAAARAELERAIAERDFAETELKRKRSLKVRGVTPEAAVEDAERAYRSATASLEVAKATIAIREAELANARALLISFNNEPTQPFSAPSRLGMSADERTIPITAPISGRVLRVIQESETTVAAGTPILEIGDTSGDLEIVAELLSTDAVRVSTGDRVLIQKWGGDAVLNGVVDRIEPWGFTKTSALGVEEQRVRTIIRFTGPAERRRGLGHGFRVEVRVVVWEGRDVLVVPSSALFRQGDRWAVFGIADGRARRKIVDIGSNNGTNAQVIKGLEEGASVVIFPGPSLAEGQAVTQRRVE